MSRCQRVDKTEEDYMSESSEIKVVSSYGEIVTYEEHCKRLAEYLEEIKREAVKLTWSMAHRSQMRVTLTYLLALRKNFLSRGTMSGHIGVSGAGSAHISEH